MSKGRAVGGYVRRSERVQGTIVHLRSESPRFEMFYQAMPILRFEPFDVSNDVDKPGMHTVASEVWRIHRTYQGTPSGGLLS